MTVVESEPSSPGDDRRWDLTDVGLRFEQIGEAGRASIDRWVQGHVIHHVPATWLAPVVDVVTGVSMLEGSDAAPGDASTDPIGRELEPMFDPGAVTSWILVSQTCDIQTSPPGAHHAFVQISPLTHHTRLPKDRLADARRDGLNYLFALDLEPTTDGEATWFADLRLIVPLSKAALLTHDPVDGFSTPERALKFGDLVAGKFRRPALHETLSEALRRAINAYVKKRLKTNAFAHTEHIRIAIKHGTRLHPTTVALVGVTKEKLDVADQALWRELDSVARTVLTPHGITVDPALLGTPEGLSAQIYRTSTPLSIDCLNDAGFW